jgi:hypothetical protein
MQKLSRNAEWLWRGSITVCLLETRHLSVLWVITSVAVIITSSLKSKICYPGSITISSSTAKKRVGYFWRNPGLLSNRLHCSVSLLLVCISNWSAEEQNRKLQAAEERADTYAHWYCYYCHVSAVPWPIIAASGLDDWIYWHLYIHTLWDYRQV